MKSVPISAIIASLVQAHFDLAYAQASFNIHDCSDSMHEVDEHEASIETLLKLVGKLKKKDLAALNSAYAKGYAKFAYLHNVFDTAPTKDTNQADALTPVSNNSDVNFEKAEGWNMFCDAFEEIAKEA